MRFCIIIMFVLMACLIAGCSMTSKATDFNGLSTPFGKAEHISTTNIALNLLFTQPIWGDATLHATVSECTRSAKAGGATKVRIVQSSSVVYWWILPPFSWVVHPVVTNVAADALP